VAFGPSLKRWASLDIPTFASRLRSPALAEVFRTIFGSEDAVGGMPAVAVIMMLGFMHKRSCGYPIGGSLEFARAIERRYRALGGRVHYNSRVERILIENDRAVGLVAAGKEYRSDEVISCIDGRTTLYDLLGAKYLSSEQRAAYESFPLFPALIYVSLGIDRDLSALPHTCVFPLPHPISLEDGAITLKQLSVRFFTFDPTMAPPGKTAAVVMIESWGIEYWRNLREHEPKRYREEKRRIAELVVDALDAEFGEIKRHVEVTDVATPVTWQRYTGNWKGSFEGFMPTGKTMMKHLGFSAPGLANFSMHSQWVSVGGGLPPAGTDGRALAQQLCKKYGTRFRAPVPDSPETEHGPGPGQEGGAGETKTQLHAPATE
jgi:phytoene dehydrogenase-like protein